MKGYTSPEDVASYLAMTFTDEQASVCIRVIEAAEIKVDKETGKSYGESLPKTEYFYDYPGPLIQLTSPVASITSLDVMNGIGGVWYEWEEGITYEVRQNGQIFIPALMQNTGNYWMVRVVYVPLATIPANIKLATEILTAHWMRPNLQDELFGIDQASLGGEESFGYTDLVQKHGVPAEFWSVLGISPGGRFHIA